MRLEQIPADGDRGCVGRRIDVLPMEDRARTVEQVDAVWFRYGMNQKGVLEARTASGALSIPCSRWSGPFLRTRLLGVANEFNHEATEVDDALAGDCRGCRCSFVKGCAARLASISLARTVSADRAFGSRITSTKLRLRLSLSTNARRCRCPMVAALTARAEINPPMETA